MYSVDRHDPGSRWATSPNSGSCGGNSLSGAMPPALGQLQNLEVLGLAAIS